MRTITYCIGISLMTMILAVSSLQGFSQNLTLTCPVIQQDFASGSCTVQAKTQPSIIKAYSAGGERGWASFDITGLPDAAVITEVKLHFYIDSQNYPFYALTKLSHNPITSAAQPIYTQIGAASTTPPYNANTYYVYQGGAVNGWNVRTLSTSAITDLQNQLQANWFAVGFWEYETSGNYFLQCHGWNQLNEPYIEVGYQMPGIQADLGLTSFPTPGNSTCEDTITVSVVLKNFGSTTLSNAEIVWNLNNTIQPTYQWSYPGGLGLGQTDTIELGTVILPQYFYNNITATVNVPAGYMDINTANNTLSKYVHHYDSIAVALPPANDTVVLGGDAQFSCDISGPVIDYQWQISTDNGLTYIDLQSNFPYYYTDSNMMIIQNVSMNQNGNLFRCFVTGYCNQLYTLAAQLVVINDSLTIDQISAYPPTICQGGTAQLSVHVTGGTGSYSYYWTSNPSGFTSTLQNPVDTPVQTTTYTVVVSDPVSTVTASITVAVTLLPGPAGTITGALSVCQGSTVTFVLPPITNATHYLWTYPQGFQGPSYTTTPSVSVTISNTAVSGIITVKGANNCGYGQPSSIYLTVNALPGSAQVINGPTVVCRNTIISYYCPNIYNAASYLWTVPPGCTITSPTSSNQITVSFGSQAVSGNITVSGNNACGQGPVTSLNVTVVNPPVVNAGPDQTITSGNSAVLTATATSGQPPYVFSWSNGMTGSSITVTPTATTTYTVTVSDVNGCISHDMVVVTVQAAGMLQTIIQTISSCSGEILVPVYVHQFYEVASASLTLQHDTSHLQFAGYLNVHPQLNSGTLLVNSTPGFVHLAWFSVVPANIGNGLLISLKFQADTGYSQLAWDLATQGACQYTDINNVTIPASFTAGSVYTAECSDYTGYVRYKNPSGTALAQATVMLMQGDTIVYSTQTNGNGYFEFIDVDAGTYTTKVLPSHAWGGVNAADALLTLKHFVGMVTLSGLNFKAGDVDNSNSLTAIDALLDVRRFVHLIDSFPAGDWVAESHTLVMNGSGNLTDSIMVLCTGDVDGSYNPVLRTEPGITLQEGNPIHVNDNQVIGIPFTIQSDLQSGSISLVLIPSDPGFELHHIEFHAQGQFLYTCQNDEIRIAWYHIEPLQLHEGDLLFTVYGRVKNPISSLSWSTGTESEITDFFGTQIPDLVLKYAVPQYDGGKLRLEQNSPNPCDQTTRISYSLPESGMVKLRLLDARGREMGEYINQMKQEGNHTFELSTASLPSGLYLYQLILETGTRRLHEMRKMIVD